MNDSLVPYEPALDLSVIISCYREEHTIHEFYSRLSRTLEAINRSYEIIFINDGSTDQTWRELKRIYETDPNVTAIVDFYKNAGQSNAKTPGVMLARGKGLVLIDSDLQLDPEQLPELLVRFDEGYDLVSGYRENRKDSLLRRMPSKLANAIMRKASGTRMQDFGCTFKIYNGNLIRGFEFGPFKPWRPLPVIAMARDVAEVPVRHHPRKHGKSGWTFRKLFAYNMEHVVNLSERPFQYLAAFCLLLAGLLVIRILLSYVFPGSILPTVSPGLLLNAIVAGTLIMLGVLAGIGEFVIRNFNILQARPAYVVREILRKETG